MSDDICYWISVTPFEGFIMQTVPFLSMEQWQLIQEKELSATSKIFVTKAWIVCIAVSKVKGIVEWKLWAIYQRRLLTAPPWAEIYRFILLICFKASAFLSCAIGLFTKLTPGLNKDWLCSKPGSNQYWCNSRHNTACWCEDVAIDASGSLNSLSPGCQQPTTKWPIMITSWIITSRGQCPSIVLV